MIPSGILSSNQSVLPPYAYLLDTYTGAAAAYSLRKLRSAYSGSAIRVRRSSDNTETDIGFNALFGLDTVSLLAFVGVGNGFVTRWYDQSGNAKDAVQTTTTLQPQIVKNGTVYTKNTKPVVGFGLVGGQDASLNLSSNFTGTAGTLINLTATEQDPPLSANGSPNGGVGDISIGCHQPFSDGTIYESFATSSRKTVGNPTPNTTNLYLYNVVSDANLFNAKINNSTLYNTTTNTVFYNTSATLFPKLGNGYQSSGTNYYFHGYVAEIIIYTSNQSSNISGINSNLNSYYTIY